MEEIDDPEVLALTSPSFADVRIDFGMARAEIAAEVAARQTAELWAAIADVLEDAERHPEVFIDDRAQLSARDRREYAVRSATADLAVRLSVAESSVRMWGDAARALRRSAPTVWVAFAEGRVSSVNARTVADTVATLPPEAHARFVESIGDAAERLAPARFRSIARAARERAHAESFTERHRRARVERRISIEHLVDGMSWLSILLPAEVATRAVAGIDAVARDALADGDDRTLDQARADVAGELLTGSFGGSRNATGVAVAVTVPVLTLLGGDEPGVLDGVGPIDPETARRLTAEAPSLSRILTHPVTGAVLAVDRTTYRVPADLARSLRHRDRSCRFTGCGRPVARCDIDHITEWQDGGVTDDTNLMHLCRHHHRLKSVARWRPSPPDPGSATIRWTSPTGDTSSTDPPPF